jgi:hypothetical protein
MGDEDGVVMVEIAVAHRCPGHMGRASGPGSSSTASLRVRRPLAVSVKDLKPPLRPDGRRHGSRPGARGRGPGRGRGGTARPSATSTSITLVRRAAAGPFSSSVSSAPGLKPHDMMQDRVGLGRVNIDQRDRPRRPARHADQHAIGCHSGVQRREGRGHRGLAPRLQHAIEAGAQWMSAPGLGQTLDLHPASGQVVRGAGSKTPSTKTSFSRSIPSKAGLRRRDWNSGRCGCRGRVQRWPGRCSASIRRAGRANPSPAAVPSRPRGALASQPRRGQRHADAPRRQCAVAPRAGHQPTSARMSA